MYLLDTFYLSCFTSETQKRPVTVYSTATACPIKNFLKFLIKRPASETEKTPLIQKESKKFVSWQALGCQNTIVLNESPFRVHENILRLKYFRGPKTFSTKNPALRGH